MQFDFTNITPIEIVKEVKAKGKTATPKNPVGLSLRIFKDGAVYPSQELVDKFNLEYWNKQEVIENTSQMTIPNGFDIWSSADWGQYPKDAQQCIFIAAVPKSETKVSVFGSVDYNADGTPIKSVLTQGAKRPELINMLMEVYDWSTDVLFGSKNYVDLDILTETVVFAGLENFYVPKSVSRGGKKGTMSYETRKNLTVMPLVITKIEEKFMYGGGTENEVEVLEETNN